MRIRVFDRATNDLRSIMLGAAIEPIFFENTRYDFYLYSESGTAKLQLPPTAAFRHKIGAIEHYSLDFQNQIGITEVQVDAGAESAVIRFEVFPRKIDYRNDYVAMRNEVASLVHNLVLSVQMRTFSLSSPIQTEHPTLVEWLSLIRYYFKKLIATTKAIEQNPHSKLVENIRNVPIERARQVNSRSLERMLRRRTPLSGRTILGSNIQLPKYVPEVTRYVTYDTAENRYIKSVLLETQHNLRRTIHTRSSGAEDADLSAEEKFFSAIRSEAEVMLREIQRLLQASFLQTVQTVPIKHPSSLVFHRHPHYAAFEKISRVLNGGLSLNGGLLRIGVKDVALLYEYWCFLKLVDILKERFDLEQQSIVRVSHLKVTVVLKKGERAAVRFRDPISGKRLFLVYNRHFTRLPTISQRPDNVIQLTSEDRLYLLDAKYRLAFDANYQRQFGGIGPTVDDINTMHRYRDAIVMPHPTQRHTYLRGIVQGAIALFPYPDEGLYQNHRFYKSIGEVQIGGLPFLPQATNLVETILASLLQSEGFAVPNEP